MTESEDFEAVYRTAFRGSFTSALRWHHLDELWACLREQAGDDWYVYAVGEAPPRQCTSREQLLNFIAGVDRLLREEHQKAYCGIVYADDLRQPGFIKIYDPNNLGVTCGYSDNPPLPGWVLSRLRPCDLRARQQTAGRRRWWRRLFGVAQ
ncbi:MAG: hypothetical protein AB2814_00315 [Candidatus Sedimenticola endophacoides]